MSDRDSHDTPPAAPKKPSPLLNIEEQRLQRLQLLEDDIGRALRQSESSGELKAAPSWGKPLDFGDGYDDTPADLRMPMKVLKDAGVVPPEVEALHRLAALRQAAKEAVDPAEARTLEQQASELQQAISMRLERLRGGVL